MNSIVNYFKKNPQFAKIEKQKLIIVKFIDISWYNSCIIFFVFISEKIFKNVKKIVTCHRINFICNGMSNFFGILKLIYHRKQNEISPIHYTNYSIGYQKYFS
ncbi:unnamed protein product [Blepharisma stoltei]|uniref:Uncharacterized protein n=1 Tax=Blepharisma stoltei TaxID=1481888 RepID=A0AAU9IS50_9CILI|nr:unnamed protein product [Blepharisma stoltei]